MAVNPVRISWQDLKNTFTDHHREFEGPKRIGTYVSAPWSNGGHSDRAHTEIIDTTNKLERQLKPIAEDYMRRHPFRPTAKAMTTPALMIIERKRYMQKTYQFLKNNYGKNVESFLWTSLWDIPSRKQPKKDPVTSSSWVKGIRVTSNNRVELNLGNRWYAYAYRRPSDIQNLMRQPSIGHVVATLRRKPAGAYYGGIRKLSW